MQLMPRNHSIETGRSRSNKQPMPGFAALERQRQARDEPVGDEVDRGAGEHGEELARAGVTEAADAAHGREREPADEHDQPGIEHPGPDPLGRDGLAQDPGDRPEHERLRVRQHDSEADQHCGVEADLDVSAGT